MKAVTTDAEIVASLKALEEHGSTRKAARVLGVNATTIQNHISMAKDRGLTAATPIMTREVKLEIALRNAQRDLRAAQREADTAERIRAEIYGLASRTPEPPPWIVQAAGVAGHRGVPMTIWSDWHYGEVVNPAEIGGLNEFNSEIARQRVTKLVDTTIDLCRNHMGRGTTKYPGIIVCLGGDMLSGNIHEELAITNDRTTQQCINELTDIIAAALERMADEFGRVFVPCVVGNHGRSTRRPSMKLRVYTSFEWNIYCSLERHFRRDKRIQFMIPGESDAYFKVYSTRFLLTHGDSLGVKGGDGIIGAIGPIMRGSLKVGRSEAQVGRDIDCIVMGHWHQMLWLPGVIVNNALKGYDEYARLAMRASYSRPSQGLWFVHPEHGITAQWQVFLEKQRTTDTTNTWVTWQEAS